MITAETRMTQGVREANRLHRYAQAQAEMAACAGRNAVTAGLKLGKLLTELKAATEHGEWGVLFDGATKLSSCAQFETQANVAHELHLNFNRQTTNQYMPKANHGSLFEFTKRTAEKYMRCYKAAKARLSATESAQLDATLNDRTVPSTPPELVAKATDGAETPRQMMLNLGVIATRKRTTHDRVKPLGFTGSGNPDGAQALTPMDKLANDLAALNLPPEELERRRHQAEQDAAGLLKQLGTFVDQGYVHLLRLQERELFAEALAAYARKVSDADEQHIKALTEGVANGTTQL